MDKLDKEVEVFRSFNTYEAIQRLALEYISKVKCCDECFAEFFCIEQQRRESRLPCKDIMKCVSSISDYLHSIYLTKADFS